MKATKKQISEVTRMAIEMNHSVTKALFTLSNCSKSIYDAIGAKGVVESSIQTRNQAAAEIQLGADSISIDRCYIVSMDANSFTLSLNDGPSFIVKDNQMVDGYFPASLAK